MILGIESSCDESALALLTLDGKLLWECVHTQAAHIKHGGVVPELAVREHLRKFPELMAELPVKMTEITKIAVTVGPGLVGSLAMGMAHAKALGVQYGIPVVGVNHLRAHAWSVMIGKTPKEINAMLPHLGLLVSGGNTILYAIMPAGSITNTGSPGVQSTATPGYFECNPQGVERPDVSRMALERRIGAQPQYLLKILAKTRDDAAGECLDKGAKMLGLPYPGGPLIEKLAAEGDPKKYNFPIAFKESGELGFSFSGLKTSLRYTLQKMSAQEVEENKKDLAASYQRTVVESLVLMAKRAMKSPTLKGGATIVPSLRDLTAKEYTEKYYKSMGVCGGVANNNLLRAELEKLAADNELTFLAAEKKHCADNAGMIAWAAWVDAGGVKSPEAFLPSLGIEG